MEPFLPPQKAFREAATVFAGTATRIEPHNEPIRRQLELSTTFPFVHVIEIGGAGVNLVTFDVAQVWKGEVQDEAIVRSGSSGMDCGYIFSEQQEYLVYTFSNSRELWTGICHGTVLLADARADIQALGPGTQPQAAAEATSTLPIPLLLAAIVLLGIVPFAALRMWNRTHTSL